MIKKDKKTYADGRTKTQIRVVESYWVGSGLPPKQRTVKSFGYLEDQDDQVNFMKKVERFNEDFKKNKQPIRLEADLTAKMYSKENQKYNYGYKYLESIYNSLNIDKFMDDFLDKIKFRGKYPVTDIFKFLVILRILNPDSKRATFQMKNEFYKMNTDFNLEDVYRSLDEIAASEIELQRHLNNQVKNAIGRDLSYAFYDVTNYFFEIDFPSSEADIRQKGVSKEHRTSPIVGMGLFMDSNGLPVSMSIFPGNTSDSITLEPTMKDVKSSYDLGRLIVVADKGLNSSKNIDIIVNNGDGYLFSQIIKGTKGQRYHEELFNPAGWISNADNTYRTKLFEEEYTGKDKDGKKITRKRKVLLYWSKVEAEIAEKKRLEKLAKAAKSVANNAYSIKKGHEEYTKENIVDKSSGEVLEDIKKIRSVDIDKAELDSQYDGYFCIITSELDYDESKIREVYHGLWKIEQSFRIMKSDLYARPVYVWTNEHIKAHFLICFAALLIVRIIQHKMGDGALSAERIARCLNEVTCQISTNGIVKLDDVGGAIAFKKVPDKNGKLIETLDHTTEDEIALDYKIIQNLFNTDINNIYHRQEEFNKLLKEIVAL